MLLFKAVISRAILAPLCCLMIFQRCAVEYPAETAEHRAAADLAIEWNRLMLDLERHTPGYRPPVSARNFAYIEMAAYEASLPALEDYISLENFCPGYQKPEGNVDAGQFNLPASLNAAYAQTLRYFFPAAPKKWLEKIDRLETASLQYAQKRTDLRIIEQSVAFGKAAAEAVCLWSESDAEGHNAYLNNFTSDYVPPDCKGCWQPGHTYPVQALLPNWGKVRGFVVRTDQVAFKAPVSFDETPGSSFHTEAVEVFSVSQPLSRENRWIAELWSDDLPGLTVTPAGRWISIANQAIAQARPSFGKVMESYLKISWALCDASILVWHAKYYFNVERPETYIRRTIRSDWTPLHDNPPFPSYPSGHSAFGAAAAEVLNAELGNAFQMTDRTHENRQEFVGTPRTYASFDEMAKENAASRVLIGVHFRMDCEEGLRMGKIVGQKVAELPLKRKDAAMLLSQ